MPKLLKTACVAALFALAATSAEAGVDFGNATTYSTTYGVAVRQNSVTPNSSLPDNGSGSNENPGSPMSVQAGAQYMSTLSGSGTETGVGYGTASALGDSLNVVIKDSNTMNAAQTNNGNQVTTVSLNGH